MPLQVLHAGSIPARGAFLHKGAKNMELAWTVFWVIFAGALAIPLAGIVLLLILAMLSVTVSALFALCEKIDKRKAGR